MHRLRVALAGVALLALAAAVAAHLAGAPRLGELWFRVDPASLNLAQAITQRYVHPALWDEVAVPLLASPAAIVAVTIACAAALLAWLVRLRR